jgi:starch synthase
VRRDDVDARVHAFGGPRDEPARRRTPTSRAGRRQRAIRTLGVDLAMVGDCAGADVVHSHTWYANMAGHLASLLHGVPHVVSAHSWSRCGRGRPSSSAAATRVSSWVERTGVRRRRGVIAVSGAMRDDVLRSYPDVDPAKVHVVHNGIDTELWSPTANPTGSASSASTPTGRA